MKTVSKMSGIALASAAATLLLAGCSAGSSDSAGAGYGGATKKVANVKCGGINSCKGTSACATATSSCKGQNSCKGQGWLEKTKTECNAVGGKVLGQA